MLRIAVVVVLAVFTFVLPGTVGAAARKGQPVPQFRVVSTSGQQITQRNYQGRLLIIDFFATWCTPCRDSVPHLVKLNQKYGARGVNILGLSIEDDDVQDVREFIADKRINYPVALAGEEMVSSFGVRSLPTIFLVDKEGLVVEKFTGFNEQIEQRTDSIINKLLSE